MGEYWSLLGNATMAALLMSPVHALFGIHIVRRGLIFIDLAIAQVAALGMSLAIAMGHEAASGSAYWYSIGFALVGALLISVTRFKLGRVPHEALIGVVYVLSTAAAIIILTFSPTGHGLEELQALLAGNIVFVTPADVVSTAWTYGAILAVMLILWRPISSITMREHEGGPAWRTVLLDFAFYSLLGFVVASSVKVAGVLVVFSWLVMPAVVAFLYVSRMIKAVAIAIPVGMIGSVVGLWLSWKAPALPFDHSHDEPTIIESAGAGGWPTGPSIVIALGTVVLAAYGVKLFVKEERRHEDSVESDS
jgi:zinc/manganese transport system permease protein